MSDVTVRVVETPIEVQVGGGIGPSMYELWLAAGNVGSLADFFNDIITDAGLTVTAASGATVSLRSLLAAIVGPVNGQSAYLTEAGREGWFVFDDDDLSAAVTADPAQGIYVAPAAATSGASGAWVRRFAGEIYPEWFGATGGDAAVDTLALQRCLAVAGTVGAEVALADDTTYLIQSELVEPDGINISGSFSSALKPADQVATTLTAAVTSGTGPKTLSVASTAGFAVGQSVMLATAPSTTSHHDAYSHANRVITAIGAGTITIGAGPEIQAHGIGAILATTTHILRCLGNNYNHGFKVDGNEANQTYAHWQNTSLLTAEGDNVTFSSLLIRDTPSDAILFGGPNGGELKGCRVIDCDAENIGGNFAHYGNCRDMVGYGNRVKDFNMRAADPVVEGGGGGIRDGHQDAAFCFSNDCYGGLFFGNTIQSGICGFGAIGSTTTTPNNNDQLTIIGNEIIDCYRPLEVTGTTKRILFAHNRCRAFFPFLTGDHRWDRHMIFVSGSAAEGRVQNVSIHKNILKNCSIWVDQAYLFDVTGNIMDNREMNGASYNQEQHYGIQLYNYEGGTVSGNIVSGGYISLWLQNSDLGANYCRSTGIKDNHFLNPYFRGVAGSLAGSSSLEGTVLRGNEICGDSGATQEDFTTVLSFDTAGGWAAFSILKGMQIEDNRIDYNITAGNAWADFSAPASKARLRNKVNGLYELLPNYADDAAATADADLPVGAEYRVGTERRQKVA